MDTSTETALLLALLLHATWPLEEPEPIFRPEGGDIEMGFCFGADYIVVYKRGLDGDLLLGNSSELPEPSPSLPASVRGRVTITTHIAGLLGLELQSLVPSDSGVYRRECWESGVLGKRIQHHLSVCLHEVDPQEITLLPGAKAELLCNDASAGHGTSVRWYRETYPKYTRTLFLDTSQSTEPLEKDLKDQLQVRNNGSLLHVSSSFLKYNHNIYCLVLEAEMCMSYQSMSLPETGEIAVNTVVRSGGDGLTLPCSSKSVHPQLLFWDTPAGLIDWMSRPAATTQASPQNGMELYLKEKHRFEITNNGLSIASLSENDSGQYKCFTPLLVKEYSLIVCPRMDPVDVPFPLGGSAILSCEPNVKEPYSVQWYRRNSLETDDLVLDTRDPQAVVPKDLWAKLNVSQPDSSLRLHNLTAEDRGEFWCAALVDIDFLDVGDYDDLPDSGFVAQCILSRRNRLVPTGRVDAPSSSVVVYIVPAAVVAAVLLAALCGILAVQLTKRRRPSRSCRYLSKRPGQQSSEGGCGDDATCTARLEPTALGP